MPDIKTEISLGNQRSTSVLELEEGDCFTFQKADQTVCHGVRVQGGWITIDQGVVSSYIDTELPSTVVFHNVNRLIGVTATINMS